MQHIFRKEVASYFDSLIAYVVLGIFFLSIGLFFWVFEYNILEPGNTFATLDGLFVYGPYLFLFLIPALTMGSFSEEVSRGTLEFLLTKPLTEWQIIGGKYLATVFLIFFSLALTLVYYFTVSWLGNPVGNLDQGATWGGYLGLFFVGCIFSAIGIWSSSLTDSQIVAFILAAFLCFFLYQGLEYLAGIRALNTLNALIIHIGLMEHYQQISQGVLDLRNVVYFLSTIAIFLLLTRWSLERR
ncbi:MAG: ABC transporter permease subunit [Bacteroidota bacterium]